MDKSDKTFLTMLGTTLLMLFVFIAGMVLLVKWVLS